MVRLEFRGRVASLLRHEAEQIHARIAAEGFESSRARDLALALDWALSTDQVVPLRRSEVRELDRLAARHAEIHALLRQLTPAAKAA